MEVRVSDHDVNFGELVGKRVHAYVIDYPEHSAEGPQQVLDIIAARGDDPEEFLRAVLSPLSSWESCICCSICGRDGCMLH